MNNTTKLIAIVLMSASVSAQASSDMASFSRGAIIAPASSEYNSAIDIVAGNTKIIRMYKYMWRLDIDTGIVDFASTDSPEYTNWIEEDGPFAHPPHIVVDGIDPRPVGDTGFYVRWKNVFNQK